MAVQNEFMTLTVPTATDLSAKANQYKAITVGGTIAASAATAIGLLQHNPRSSAVALTLGVLGTMKAHAGAAVNSGARLTVTTSGYIIAATSANIAAGDVRGTALEGASSGDLFKAWFVFGL